MKASLIISFCLFILISGCKQTVSSDQSEVSSERQEAITVELKSIAMEFLKSWEPPFDPDGAVALFTQSADFHLIIDGMEISDYEDWSRNVPNFMSDDNYFFESYKHEVKSIETVVLSPKSGVVTIVYIWDSVSKQGIHERTPGAITLTCREEENVWRIVHYHGSHDEAELVKK